MDGFDSLESTIVDRKGRLFVAGSGRLFRLDRPDGVIELAGVRPPRRKR